MGALALKRCEIDGYKAWKSRSSKQGWERERGWKFAIWDRQWRLLRILFMLKHMILLQNMSCFKFTWIQFIFIHCSSLSLSLSHQHHATLPYQYTITHPFLSLHLYLYMFLSINQCILFYHMMAMWSYVAVLWISATSLDLISPLIYVFIPTSHVFLVEISYYHDGIVWPIWFWSIQLWHFLLTLCMMKCIHDFLHKREVHYKL